MGTPVLYLATRSGRQRAREQMVASMSDLFQPDGSLSAALVASAAPSGPQNCCALGLCTASLVASAAGRKACCVTDTCFSDGWSVHR